MGKQCCECSITKHHVFISWMFEHVLTVALAVTGWKDGAPTDACVDMVCVDMLARHFDITEAMPCPYTLKLEDDTTTYIPGETVKGMSHSRIYCSYQS